MNDEPRSSDTTNLRFDPDQHPEDTLKVFNEFCDSFLLRYNALFPDPPKVSMDSAIARWTFLHTTQENANPRPTMEQYDAIRNDGPKISIWDIWKSLTYISTSCVSIIQP